MEQILFSGITIEQLIEKIGELLDKKLLIKSNNSLESKRELLSRIQAAAVLKITLPTLHEWTKSGWLRSYKKGRRVYYKLEEVMEDLKSTSVNKHKKYIL